MSATIAEVALVMFVGMGPIKVLVFYLDATRHAAPPLGRRVALRAVATATIVALGLGLAGALLMRLLHFSAASLIIAGGIVLLAYGIQVVLDTAPSRHVDTPPSEADLMRMAVHPMGVPLILNPAGIAGATILSAEAATLGDLGLFAFVVVAIAVLDVVVLFTARPVARWIPPEATLVLEKVLGVLLAAVAVELIVIGLVQLRILDVAPH